MHQLRAATAWALHYGGVGALLRNQKGRRVTILCFHRIQDDVNHVWPSLPVNSFHHLLKYINKHYHVCLPGPQLYEAGKPKLIITFDDGYYDFVEYALPLLNKYRFPAIHHVVLHSVITGKPNWTYVLNMVVDDYMKSRRVLEIEEIKYKVRITVQNAARESLYLFHQFKKLVPDRRKQIMDRLAGTCIGDLYFPRMMNVTDLQQCQASGIAIGSHGYYHDILNEGLSVAELQCEILESRQRLEQLLGKAVDHFAFPNGEYTASALELCGAAGYKYLYTTRETCQEPPPPQSPYPWLMPRLLMPARSKAEMFLYVECFHHLFRFHDR